MKNLQLKLKALTARDVLFISISIMVAGVVALTIAEAIHTINVYHISLNRLFN